VTVVHIVVVVDRLPSRRRRGKGLFVERIAQRRDAAGAHRAKLLGVIQLLSNVNIQIPLKTQLGNDKYLLVNRTHGLAIYRHVLLDAFDELVHRRLANEVKIAAPNVAACVVHDARESIHALAPTHVGADTLLRNFRVAVGFAFKHVRSITDAQDVPIWVLLHRLLQIVHVVIKHVEPGAAVCDVSGVDVFFDDGDGVMVAIQGVHERVRVRVRRPVPVVLV